MHYHHSLPNQQIITTPRYIKKKRAPKGIACYEIVWNHEQLLPLIPPEQIECEHDKLFSSIEPQHLVIKTFPELVKVFEESKLKPVKQKKPKMAGKVKKISDFVKVVSKDVTKESESLFDDVDDEYDADLSLIVDEICNKGVPLVIKKKINELVQENVNEVSFFDLNMNEDGLDAFERSVFEINSSDDDDDDEY